LAGTVAEPHASRVAAAWRDGVAEQHDAALSQGLPGDLIRPRDSGLGCDDEEEGRDQASAARHIALRLGGAGRGGKWAADAAGAKGPGCGV
jgi:hypothetical protein